ncbi:AMP-binding protein [Kribbella sp. DT2]|uniref:class I adenylate-forming enzyme family protein n=1 Tax=Kribbella sp. DT2 TaxID=3393427 RepID=UPI003CED9F1B
MKTSLRAQLAADPSVGTGNVLATVIALGADLNGPGLTFDTAVDHFPAERPLTLGELDERVQARTAWLHARGIGRRDVVAIWATDAADIVLSFLALTRVGAIPALLNGKMAPPIASEYIRRLRVNGILADNAHRALLEEQARGKAVGDAAEEVSVGLRSAPAGETAGVVAAAMPAGEAVGEAGTPGAGLARPGRGRAVGDAAEEVAAGLRSMPAGETAGVVAAAMPAGEAVGEAGARPAAPGGSGAGPATPGGGAVGEAGGSGAGPATPGGGAVGVGGAPGAGPSLLHGAPILGTLKELGAGDPAKAPGHYQHHRDDPVVITHTSGTTGVPKAVLHTHTTLYAALKHLLTMPQAQGTDRILNALPVPHTATILMVNQVLGNRAEMLLLSSQDAPVVLAAIERWQPRGVYGFAVTWAGLAREDLSRYAVGSVRMWFNTGDCAHEPHIRKLVAAGSREAVTREGRVTVPGSHFVDGLGSSEMGHNGFHITHTPDSAHYGRCIGKPYQFAQAAVLDAQGNELPDGTPGMLGFRSPSVSPGYWNDSVNTYRFRLNGWFLTGDLAYRDAGGHFFHLDRVPDAVAGFDGPQLYTSLSEERILAALPEVLDCTVIVVPEGDGFVTDVLLELKPDSEAELEEQVKAAVGEEVAATIRRVTVVGADDVPVTVTGKVRKVALRQDRLVSP